MISVDVNQWIRNEHRVARYILTNHLQLHYLSMQNKANKPYFIEVYSAPNTLTNKYKFVLAAQYVKELKNLIRDKLIAKQEIQPDTQFVIKDNDDFELGSDDQINDVIPDYKVRIYPKIKQPVPPPLVAPVVPLGSQSQIPAAVPVVPTGNEHKLVSKNGVLDFSKMVIPILAPETKMKMRLICPQIRRTAIELPFEPTIDSYFQLSKYIVSVLGLDSNLKAVCYNSKGQPFFYNLDLMYMQLPKIDFSQEIHILFTVSPSSVDEQVLSPPQLNSNISEVSLLKGNSKYSVEIDLDNTVNVLKYKVFKITRIHPNNQIIKFANKPLSNNVETLKSYGVLNNSILELNFKLNSNLVPCTYADKFYYKDIKHIRQQSDNSITQLRSNLLALSAHLSDSDKLKWPYFIRALTHNMPLTYGIKCLMRNNFVSQCHRIAIQQGLMLALSEHIRLCNPELDKLEYSQIFTHFRDFLDYTLQAFKKITDMGEVRARAQDVEVQTNCHFTIKPIKIPRLIKLDNNEIVIVDKEQMEEQILKGFTYPLLKAPKQNNLYATKDLEEFYHHYLTNQLDNPNTNALYWIGFKQAHPQVVMPPLGAIGQFKGRLDAYGDLKVHQPLQIKNKTSVYLLLRDKLAKLRVFVSKNKDIAKPFNLYSVLTGQQEAVNLDLMSGNVKSQNVQEVIDMSDFKAVITRDPKQAIAVLFDISGSMGSKFFNEPDLKRIGAVKSFFEAFAYRTIAYNLEHVVSLFFFDNVVDNPCGFTQAIYDFNRLISTAAPRRSTTMYDAIAVTVKSLAEFKTRYPDCILRILALTDGEDTGSKHTIQDATRMVIDNNIIVDSFAVGANCEGLKIISKASGGKCYLTRHLEQSLKLFEQETVLSVRARKLEEDFKYLPVEKRIQKAKLQAFDLPNNVHDFQMPKSEGGGLSAKEAIKKMEGAEESKKISGNASLKRIARQIQNYTDNPHPFIAIFPCANINLWKILLLGPKQTPYENGLFLLYAQFPGDYPFKAPEVRFITPIYHCNMNSQGRICHSVFDRNYSPAISFRQIMDCVYGLILTPEPEDPLDNVVASFYLSEYQTYYKNAIAATKEKASNSSQKVVDELFGKIVDDIERKKKEVEIEEWVTLAKSFN